MPEQIYQTIDIHNRRIGYAVRLGGVIVVAYVYNPYTERPSQRVVSGHARSLTEPERKKYINKGLTIFGESLADCPNIAALDAYTHILYDPSAIQTAIEPRTSDQATEQTVTERQELAVLLRNWRRANELRLDQLGELLEISPRTLEGIEQGRGFRYHKILVLALIALQSSIDQKKKKKAGM
jgi:hypothetical protein